MRLTSLGVLASLVAGLAGCSGTADPAATSGGSIADRTVAAAPVSTEKASLEWDQVVSVATLPEARCMLHPAGNVSKSVQLYGAREGIVRFFAPGPSWGRSLAIDCSNPDGTSASYRVNLDDPSTFFREPDLREPGPILRTRPALEGDPMAIGQSELRARGYPRRPDPIAEPARYAHWLRVVSHPVDEVAPRLVTHPELAMAGLWTTKPTSIWGGPVVYADLGSPSYTFAAAELSLTVPSFSNQPSSEATLWTGIGGAAATDPGLIQDGVLLSGGAAAIWYEYAGTDNEVGMTIDTSVAVNQGDEMYFECWVSDANGNDAVPPTLYGTYYALNETSWRETGTTLTAQFQTNSSGEGGHYDETLGVTFEYIIERPTRETNGTFWLPPLLDYGSAWMWGQGYDTKGGSHDLTTDYYDYYYLYGTDSSGQFTGLLENNYQPGENPYAPSDDWVFWQWSAGQ